MSSHSPKPKNSPPRHPVPHRGTLCHLRCILTFYPRIALHKLSPYVLFYPKSTFRLVGYSTVSPASLRYILRHGSLPGLIILSGLDCKHVYIQNMFTVQSLDLCKVCLSPIDRKANKRLRSYCSVPCRELWNSRNTSQKRTLSGKSKEYQRERSGKFQIGKIQCAICFRWYRRPAHHAWQIHGIRALGYKKAIGYFTSKGLTSKADNKKMHNHAIKNNMPSMLTVKGKQTRFKPDDPRARKRKPLNGKPLPISPFYPSFSQ